MEEVEWFDEIIEDEVVLLAMGLLGPEAVSFFFFFFILLFPH